MAVSSLGAGASSGPDPTRGPWAAAATPHPKHRPRWSCSSCENLATKPKWASDGPAGGAKGKGQRPKSRIMTPRYREKPGKQQAALSSARLLQEPSHRTVRSRLLEEGAGGRRGALWGSRESRGVLAADGRGQGFPPRRRPRTRSAQPRSSAPSPMPGGAEASVMTSRSAQSKHSPHVFHGHILAPNCQPWPPNQPDGKPLAPRT